MIDFEKFRARFQQNFADMITGQNALFATECDGDALWNLYLDSFPEGTNPIYRTRREFDCSCCRHFIKQMGGVVVISGTRRRSIWNFDAGDPDWQIVIDALDRYVMSKPISNVFLSKEDHAGTDYNREIDHDTGKLVRWNHFFLKIPAFAMPRRRASVGDELSQYRADFDVFCRSLRELTLDSVDTVLELIAQNSLYKGEEWKTALEIFRTQLVSWGKLESEEERLCFAWKASQSVPHSVRRIRNTSMGTLLIDLSEGMDLDAAVSRYEQVVAPTNYKRPKPVFTKKMLEDARKTLQELGYMNSLSRRHARLDDISANNILFCNRDSAKRIADADVFDEMLGSLPVNAKSFDRVEEIPVDKFIRDVLPTARELEVLLENRHASSMVSLIAPGDADAKSMFKWNNAFSWAYTGNMTDSDIRQNVKNAGGSVDGVLRFSIQWNDDDCNPNDFDAHCYGPCGHISFMRPGGFKDRGNLDVDIIHPVTGTPAVENITWPEKKQMRPGEYEFFVHCYSNRGGRSGFRAEIEFDGQIHSFEYPHELKQDKKVRVAIVVLNKDGSFSLKDAMPSTIQSKTIWGIQANQFIPVSTVMYSPNYWDGQTGVGHRHVFFMLNGCVNNESPNGMYNEFLKPELEKHRKVFEALGAKMRCELTDDQLSGVGFSTTKRSDITVRVKGTTERILKIRF